MDEDVLCFWHQKETVKQKNDKNLISARGITPEPVDKVEKCIRQLESKHDLLQYKVDGWCVWPLLRLSVGYALEALNLTKRESISRVQLVRLATHDFFCLTRLRPARYVAKSFTSGLVEQEGSRYVDIWFDDLLREVGDYFKIEGTNNPTLLSRRRLAFIKSDLTTNLFDVVAAFMTRVTRVSYLSKIAEKFSSCLQGETGLDVFGARWVEIRLLHFYWQKRLFSWLFRQLRPEYLLTADPGEHGIVAAAKERGIKVVELLHGYVHRYHYAYAWANNAVKYKRWMPIPDRLLLYGEHGRKELESNGFWGDALRVVGSLRMDRYRERKVRKEGRDVCNLLLTTQGIDVNRTIDFMRDFLDAIRGHLELSLCIKLHPVNEMRKDHYEDRFQNDTRVKILLGNESPSTFELLTWANVHLSISSTCHYEALGLGVPTVILAFSTYEIVLPLYESGHAFLARTPSELLEIVLRWKKMNVPAAVGEYYFKKGALENIKRELSLLHE